MENKFIFLTFGIVVFSVIFVAGLFWWRQNQERPMVTLPSGSSQTVTQSSLTPSNQQSKNQPMDTVFDVPEFYPGFSWRIATNSDAFLGEQALIMDSNSISLDGQQLVSSQTIACGEEANDRIESFEKYYETELFQRGWQ